MPVLIKNNYFNFKTLVISAIILFLVIFNIFPLCYLVFKSLFDSGTFNLNSFIRIYTRALNWNALKNTLISSFFAMIFGVLIAFPLAWLVGRTDIYGKKFFRTLFVMTYMTPPYVGAMAWLRLLNPKVGTLNLFLAKTFGLSENPFNIYSMAGLIWVLTSFYYPYAFITISRAMEKMNPSLEEAARISGASPLRTLFTVTFPVILPSVIAAGILVFIAAASCYGIPSIIGAPAKIDTVTTRIIDYVYVGSAEGLNDAAALAVSLMIIANLALYVSSFISGRKNFITVSGKSTRPNIINLGKWRVPLTIFMIIFALVVVIIPFATVAMTSFTKNLGKPLSESNFTLKYWEILFTRQGILDTAKNSLISASAAATLGVFISCVMAWLLTRTKAKGRKIPDYLITIGSSSPSVVIALALIMTMTGKFGINIYNTLLIMIIAYVIKYLLMGMRTIVSAMSQIHPSLEEASTISGASWFKTFTKITLPLIAPSVVAGWFLIFMPSFYELTMSTLLYSTDTKTIGYELFTYQTYHSQQTASAIATGILIMVIVVNWLLDKLTKGNFSI